MAAKSDKEQSKRKTSVLEDKEKLQTSEASEKLSHMGDKPKQQDAPNRRGDKKE